MKSLIISLVIAAAIIAGSIAYGMHMDKVSSELMNVNERLTQSIMEEDFAKASEIAEEMREYLDKKRTMMTATDNHEVLDKIEIYMRELSSYIGEENKADALSRCRVLEYLYDHLPKNYELRLENVL